MSPFLVRVILLAVMLLAGAGCANFAITDKFASRKFPRHYVLVDRDGYPIEVREKSGEDERTIPYERHLENIIKGIDDTVKALIDPDRPAVPCPAGSAAESSLALSPTRGDAPLRLLLFAHGGINSYSDGFRRMKALFSQRRGFLNLYDGQNPAPHAAYYPIFINWNSDLLDSIIDEVFLIRDGRRVEWWKAAPSAPFVILGRLVGSAFGVPLSLGRRTTNYLTDDTLSQEDIQRDSLSAALFPLRFLTAPVVEAFGTPAWQIMKRRAQLAVAGRLRPREDTAREKPAQEGAARTLVETLLEPVKSCGKVTAWLSKSGLVPVEITLVGHSLGTLLLNRLLAVAGGRLPIDRIVQLAPASGIDEVEGHVVPYLRLHENAKFWWFSLSRSDEARESSYFVLPQGTLLEWIDTLFERPRTTGQSTSGRADNVSGYYLDGDRTQEAGQAVCGDRFVSTKDAPLVRDRVVFCVSRRQSDEAPAKHGDFDEPRFLGQILCTVDPRAFTEGFCKWRVNMLQPYTRSLGPLP